MKAIVAYDKNRIIGVNGRIPWKLPYDLKHFKEYTLNQTVIMGNTTYHSIGHGLPNRTNIVMSKNPNVTLPDALVYNNVSEVIRNHSNGIVIGGEAIYRLLLTNITEVVISVVDTDVQVLRGDKVAMFPNLDLTEWTEETISRHSSDNSNQYSIIIKKLTWLY